MNREYYCKVGSDAELRDVVKDLKGIEETVDTYTTLYSVIPEKNKWCWIGWRKRHKEWSLFEEEPEGILVDSKDLIDKVVSKKTSKFEVGKWYRLGKWISKFKGIKNNIEFWAESINTESGFYDKNGYLCLDIYTPKLITDLSEIQKHLPDGHPDKIKEFVLPEKWCVKVQRHGCPRVVREWRQRPLRNYGDWQNSGYICGDTGYHTGSTKNFPIGYTEITLEQFKKYVLKEEEEKVMYIKCTDSEDSYCTHPQAKEYGCINYTGKPLKKGKIYKVIKYIEINPGQFGYSCACGDGHYLIGETGIIVSTKEEYENQFKTKENVKKEFKIGDWITITGSDTNWGPDMDKYIGRTVQITGYIDSKGVEFEDCGGWYWCYEEKHFRRATTEEIISVAKSEESYKIGDYVVITNNTNNSNNRVGDIGVITEIMPSASFRVQVDGRPEHGNWIRPTDLRKARPDEIKDEIEAKTETYKNGDWVVVLKAKRSSNEDGDVGVVKESSGTSFRVHVPGKTNLSNWTTARNVRKALPHEIPHQDEYICKADPIHTSDEPRSLLDREEIEVTIKETTPKQFNIF